MPQIQRLNCDLLLFDLDGVLIDSTPCIVRHWRRWAQEHGLNLDTILAAAHGVRTIETMRTIAPHLDVDAEAARFTDHEVADTAGVSAITGAATLLASLPPETWAIVTSAGSALAKARLKAAGLPLPRLLVSADDVVRGKPDPEPYTTAARQLGCPPDRCVVVEDAPAGAAAGRSAGMRVIAVTATHTEDALIRAGATVTADRLSQLTATTGRADFRLAIQVEAG
jgi:sugar-phosphatase